MTDWFKINYFHTEDGLAVSKTSFDFIEKNNYNDVYSFNFNYSKNYDKKITSSKDTIDFMSIPEVVVNRFLKLLNPKESRLFGYTSTVNYIRTLKQRKFEAVLIHSDSNKTDEINESGILLLKFESDEEFCKWLIRNHRVVRYMNFYREDGGYGEYKTPWNNLIWVQNTNGSLEKCQIFKPKELLSSSLHYVDALIDTYTSIFYYIMLLSSSSRKLEILLECEYNIEVSLFKTLFVAFSLMNLDLLIIKLRYPNGTIKKIIFAANQL